jgi:hypothetical protein
MMGLIGFTVGLIGFVMHQLIDLISNFKWSQATDYLVNVSKSPFVCIIESLSFSTKLAIVC